MEKAVLLSVFPFREARELKQNAREFIFQEIL